MADDGRGREITIPGVLISKKEGDRIIQYMKDHPTVDVVMEIDFEMEHESNIVKLDVFLTADTEVVYKLLKDFYFYNILLKGQVNLTMHYITYNHISYDPKNPVERSNCLGGGKYCNTPGKFGILDGRAIVHESIKQKCVYKYGNNSTNEAPLIYWNYMIEFYSACLNVPTGSSFNSTCSAAASKSVNLPQKEINECIIDSYIATKDAKAKVDFENSAENTLLNIDNESRKQYLINYIPSITINNRTFWGSWTADNLFEAVCAGFQKKPDFCNSTDFAGDSKMSWLSVWLIVAFIIIANVVIFTLCKNYIRKKIVERIESTDINHKINTVVTSYLALRETK